MKRGLLYTIFLILTVIFSNLLGESYNKRQVYSMIEDHLRLNTLKLSENRLSGRQVKDYLKDIDITKMGQTYLVGDHYARLTYRILYEEINQNVATASIFTTIPSSSLIATENNGRKLQVNERMLIQN